MNRTKLVIAGLVALVFFGISHAQTKPDFNLGSSVVKLRSAPKGQSGSGGTGFLVSASNKNYTATNWHVCRSVLDGDKTVHMYAERLGEFQDVQVTVQAIDRVHDLCLLDAVPGTAVKLGSKPALFTKIFMMGHPLLKEKTIVEGRYHGELESETPFPMENGDVCVAPDRPLFALIGVYCLRNMTLGDTTLQTFPGNSGSPVITQDGSVVGVMESLDERTGWGGFVPVRYLKALLEGK